MLILDIIREKEVVMELTLGTKIIGNFGGYEPLWEGEVVEMTFNANLANKEVKVRWDNDSTTWVVENEIDANKGIGYFTEDGFYG
jgi:hypothetical protein